MKEEDSPIILFSSSNTIQDKNEVWFLDSGYSNHIKGNKPNFVEINTSYNSRIELGDRKKLKVEDKGIVVITTTYEKQKMIT